MRIMKNMKTKLRRQTFEMDQKKVIKQGWIKQATKNKSNITCR